MKNNRYTPEQIIRKLREAAATLTAGTSVPEVARELGISEATFHRWRSRYGGMHTDAMKRLRELEKRTPASRRSSPNCSPNLAAFR